MNYRKLLVIALFFWVSFIAPHSVQASEDAFCFAHISDVHIEDEGHLDKFLGAISYFNNTLHPPFIIDTGDTVSNHLESNFQLYALIERTSENSLYTTPGNHDNPGLSIFERIIGPADIAFTYSSYRFIGFSSQNINFAWLEQELSQAGPGKSILFSHAPVIWPPPDHEFFNLSLENREKLKDLMVEYQVLAYLSGHLHRSFSIKTGIIRDISTTTLGQEKYQLICIQEGEISNFPLDILADPSPFLYPTPTPPADLTTITLQPTSDTYVGRWTPEGTNYCNGPNLKIGYNQENETLINFNLSAIPQSSIIKEARLKLYASGWSGQNFFIDIYPVLNNWQACSANWENSRNLRENPIITFYTQGIGQWHDVKLTSTIQAWVNNPAGNKGILLSQANRTPYSYNFSSLENSSADNRPKLIVTYRTGLISPTPGPCPAASQGDLDCNEKINEADLTLLLNRWGEADLPTLTELFQNWQP